MDNIAIFYLLFFLLYVHAQLSQRKDLHTFVDQITFLMKKPEFLVILLIFNLKYYFYACQRIANVYFVMVIYCAIMIFVTI